MSTMASFAFTGSIGIMDCHVSFELVGSWETFTTSCKGASEGSFSRVYLIS
jgi:hypothetical protein